MNEAAATLPEIDRQAVVATWSSAPGAPRWRRSPNADQALVDDAVRALAWSLYRPEHARALAELAVADTGLGNVADKITKNQRKTFGTLRDLLRVRTVGVIEEDPRARHRQIRQARGRGRRAHARRPTRRRPRSTRR